jgi:hypothetical protein
VSIFNLASCNSDPNYFTSALKWASDPVAFLAPTLVTLAAAAGAFEAPGSLGAIAVVTIFGLMPLTPV